MNHWWVSFLGGHEGHDGLPHPQQHGDDVCDLGHHCTLDDNDLGWLHAFHAMLSMPMAQSWCLTNHVKISLLPQEYEVCERVLS